MTNTKKWTSNYFCGKEITEHEKKEGFISYRTFASVFDCVLCNGIAKNFDNWTLENGQDYDAETGEYVEVFQYYIIDNYGAELINDYTDDLLWYDEDLDIYIWGVTFFGTSWDYVNTNIALNIED